MTLTLFDRCAADPISAEQARLTAYRNHRNSALYAKTARARAIICLRLLLGENQWSDGYERALDNVFEMGDGDEVCGWLIQFAEEDSRVHELLVNHWNLKINGTDIIQHWTTKGYRLAHRRGELALA